MFPLNAIPTPGNTQFQVFYAKGTDWQTWQKPAGCSMVYIFALGGGGGGGRPADGATTVGGGGGGSGGITRALIPAVLLPDTIYVQPGVGGLGANLANNAGSNGNLSCIAILPNTNIDNSILLRGKTAQLVRGLQTEMETQLQLLPLGLLQTPAPVGEMGPVVAVI